MSPALPEKYQYTPDMLEISGFGGEYEQACRAMVVAGLLYLDEAPRRWEDFDEISKPFPPGLAEAMNDATKGEATGAMFWAAVGHMRLVARLGWDGYKAESQKRMKSKQEGGAK